MCASEQWAEENVGNDNGHGSSARISHVGDVGSR